MHYLLRYLGAFVERRPGRVVLAVAMATVVLGMFASQQQTDTDMTAFAPEGELADSLTMVQERFTAQGTNVQVIVDAGATGNVRDPDGAALAAAIRSILANDPQVAEGLADDVSALVTYEEDPTGSLLSLDVSDDLARARAGIVHIELDSDLTLAQSSEVELRIDELVAGVPVPDGFDVAAMSQAIISQTMLDDSESEMGRLLALSFLIIVVILAIQFRRVSDVVMALVGLTVAITWMFGLGVLLGPRYLGLTGDFTQISIVIPVLLVGLGVDYAIHLGARYREERRHGLNAGRSANAAVRTVGGALVLATATTLIGFLTNIASPLPPLADFGIFTAAGMLSAFVVSVMLLPSARNLLDTRRARRTRTWRPDRVESQTTNGTFGQMMGKLSMLALRAPWVVIAVALVITVSAAGAATQIDTEFSQDDFIAADSDLGVLLSRVDELFGGDLAEATYVVVNADLAAPEVAAALDESLIALSEVPNVRVAAGAAQVEVFPADNGQSVLSIATSAGQDTAHEVRTGIEQALAPLSAAGTSIFVTSENLVIDEVLDALTASQAQGIGLTLVAAMLLLVFYYGVVERRPALGAITMIPSMAVVAWVLGTMWLLGYSFNVLTAMVASIGIGIGVPFGIHITHRFLEDRRRYGTLDEALFQTLANTGGAMAGSAATTAGGFGVLVFASLMPMRQFGTIVAIAILYSFLAAVVIQPSVLRLWADLRARRGDVVELPQDDHRTLETV